MRGLIADDRSDFIRKTQWICLALGIVGVITFVYFKVISVNSTTVALTLLLAVLGIAAKWGLLESIIASVAAMLCFNYYFLPPVGKWTIADPQNWVARFAFVVTAAVASQLSASATKRAAKATNRQNEMERLYELSRLLMSMDTQSPFAAQIAGHMVTSEDRFTLEFIDQSTGEIIVHGREFSKDGHTRSNWSSEAAKGIVRAV